MERALIVLLVGLLSAFFVDAQRRDNEEMLEGPEGLKAFVGHKGGGIRLYREMPLGPGVKGPQKTGEIEIRLGRIRETNGTDVEDMDSEDMDSSRPTRPPRRTGRPPPTPTRPPGGPQGSDGPRGRPSRPRIDRPDQIDFDVQNRKNQNLQRGRGREINGDCVILRGRPPMRKVNESTLTLTVCAVKDNGTLMIGDEDTEISSGQLKFTLQLDNWPWSIDGQFVDVDVIIKLPRGRKVSEKDRGGSTMGRKRPVTFSLDDNSIASFPTKVELDNNMLVDMPDEFPSAPRRRQDHYVITLRFPRFNTTVFYDPTVDTTNERTAYANTTDPTDDATTTPKDGGMASFASILPLSVGLLLALTANKFAL